MDNTKTIVNKPIQYSKTNIVSNFVKPLKIFKIIVIGDSNVGKTCLTYRFCSGNFPSKSEVTIGVDFRERIVNCNGEEIKLQLWDTAGQEKFRQSMIPHYYRNVHAVIFVYDVTKASTFESLIHWIKECQTNGIGSHVPCIIIGNKCDEPAVISTFTAQKFADIHGFLLFETSAKADSEVNHIEAIFFTLAYKLHSSRPIHIPSGESFQLEVGNSEKSNSTCFC